MRRLPRGTAAFHHNPIAMLRLLPALALLLSLFAGTASAQLQSGEIRKASLPLSPRMPVEVVVQKPELAMDVPMRAGVAFIGGFATPSFSPGDVKSARLATAVLRERVGDLGLGALVAEAAARKLDRDGFAPEFDVETIAIAPDEIYLRRDRPAHKRVMVLEPTFGFDAEAIELKLVIRLQIEDRIDVDGRRRARPQFQTAATYAYTDNEIIDAADRDARMALWEARIADRDYALRLLREAVDPAFDQINDAFRHRNEPVDRDAIRKESIGGVNNKLIVLREADGRRWLKIAPTISPGLMRSIGPLPAR
jgi:hypothetical protein